MKQYAGFEAKKAENASQLPVGAYVLNILDAKEASYDYGSVVLISFDVAEGEHKDHFAADYRSQDREDKRWRGTYRLRIPKDDGSEQDRWAKRQFNNFIWAIETSNPGYHFDWDETKFKGKKIGGLFRLREWAYNGKTGWMSECGAITSVQDVREGTFTLPKDRPLQNSTATQPTVPDAFADYTQTANNDLPF